jgi:hypothetical protein
MREIIAAVAVYNENIIARGNNAIVEPAKGYMEVLLLNHNASAFVKMAKSRSISITPPDATMSLLKEKAPAAAENNSLMLKELMLLFIKIATSILSAGSVTVICFRFDVH